MRELSGTGRVSGGQSQRDMIVRSRGKDRGLLGNRIREDSGVRPLMLVDNGRTSQAVSQAG